VIGGARRFLARNAVASAASAVLHVVLALAIFLTPKADPRARRLTVGMTEIKPPEPDSKQQLKQRIKPDTELPPPAKRPPPKPKKVVDLTKKPPPKPVEETIPLKLRPEGPPPDPSKPPVRAVTGVTLSSVTGPGTSGGGWAVPVGNTTLGPPTDKHVPLPEVPSAPPRAAFEVDKMPAVLTQPEVRYPEEARRQGVEGQVVVNIEIDEKGRVRKVKLVKGIHPLLDAAAIEGVRKMRFRPARAAGEAVPVKIRYVYTFVLDDW